MTGGRFFAITGVILIVVLAIVGLQSVFVVDPTKYALVLRFGQPVDTALEPGLYFKVPFIDNVVYIEKRLISFSRTPQSTLQEENEIVAGDQRRINVLAFGRYRITDPLRFYESVGTVAVANSRLLAILDAAVRTVLGDASFQQIVRDDRTGLMSAITERVAQGATNLGVEVVDVRIQRLDLPQDNADRIYVRMQTERQQEAALIRAQGEEAARRIRAAADREVTVTIANANRDAEVLRGAGDAEANLIYARAYGQDEEFFRFYRSMQAYNVGLTPSTTTMMLSPTSDFFRYFNLIGTIDVPPTPLDPALLPEVPAVPDVPALPDPVVTPAPAGDGAVPAGP
jgi:membrane protease subunit HflC